MMQRKCSYPMKELRLAYFPLHCWILVTCADKVKIFNLFYN